MRRGTGPIAKIIAASALYAAGMYGAYRLAIWGYEYIGLWIVAVAVAIALPIGLWFDRRDKQHAQRLG